MLCLEDVPCQKGGTEEKYLENDQTIGFFCRCLLHERKYLEGVDTLVTCILILLQSMNVLDVLKDAKDPSLRFQFSLCQTMVMPSQAMFIVSLN